jgi:hypothetical protein
MNYTARIRQGAAGTKIAGIADPFRWVNACAVVKRRLFAPHFELIAPMRMICGVAGRSELKPEKI